MIRLTRKRLLLTSVAVIACVVAWLALAPGSGPPFGVTRSAYRAIRLGMSIEDVEHIIGRAADAHPNFLLYYSTNPDEQESDENRQKSLPEWWSENDSMIEVSLDQDKLVCRKCFYFRPIWDRLLMPLQSFWGKLGF